MALLIQSSNRVERLQQNLSQALASRPLSNPMVAEIVIVPTYAMARWLNLRIAQQQGIAANIQYPLPAGWLWQIAASLIDDVPEQDPLQVESMGWKIFAVLPELLPRPGFDQLRAYLSKDETGVKRWQLSSRIAEVFDRYQQYRPQMIRDWSNQTDNDWQAQIWQALVAGLDGHHRVDILGRLIQRLRQPDSSVELPQRISLFAISSLPPLTLEVIHALAEHTEITLYQHSPTDQYFADLKSARSMSQLQLSDPQRAQYYETGNELLASWGRQGQTMQELLLEQGAVPNEDIEFNHPPGNASLLQSIQQNIFDLNTSSISANTDDSISIHICHSAMRECQVLHDQLLNTLSENTQLCSEDILVMVPEISRYAPYIEAVFGYEENPDKPYLPWNLSDISISDEHPLVQSFLQLLALPASRFEVSEVMSLLEIAEIRQRFDIDQTVLSDIQLWLESSRLRWGIDAEFKTTLGLPATIENTWQQAQQRLFAGYALGEVDYWNGVAPLAQMDSDRAVNVGKFCQLFERLQYWRVKLSKSARANEWIALLHRLIDDFYQNTNPSEDKIQDIRDSIDLLNQARDYQISTMLLRDWLEKQLATQHRQGRLFSGGITFCGMRPMRNLPFQVICLLGMNDYAFPRRPQNYDFDLMKQNWQLGDPRSADEDRYLMLETLLCARQKLYISYSGRSLKDNSECQPSVLIQELLDFIDNQFDYASEDNKPSRQLIQLHPMQAFSETGFMEPHFSFDRSWCEISRRLNSAQQSVEEISWPQKINSPDQIEQGDIDLEQLHRFIRHPIKYFFNTQLKIYLNESDENINDEYFSLDSLSAWQIKTRLADDLLRGQSIQSAILSAEGMLPHGPAAMIELDNIREQQREWFEQLSPYVEAPKQSQSINLVLGEDRTVYGEVERYFPGRGLMQYNASRLKGTHLLELWLDHLSLCASGLFGENDVSQLITVDHLVNFQKLGPEQAINCLVDLIELFIEGQSNLLPIFPASSYAFAIETDPDKARKNSNKAWYHFSPKFEQGDCLDPYIQLALRNATQDPVNLPAFAEYSTRLYQTLLQYRA